jgi:hypothetical protein
VAYEIAEQPAWPIRPMPNPLIELYRKSSVKFHPTSRTGAQLQRVFSRQRWSATRRHDRAIHEESEPATGRAVKARLLVVLWVVSTALGGCATEPLHRRDWFSVETSHFAISSSLQNADTRQLVLDLEKFRAIVEFLQGAAASPSTGDSQTLVYAFDGRGVFRPFAVRGESSAFLTPEEGEIILLRTGRGWRVDATPELRRAYADFLFRNRQGDDRPVWLQEGFAQLASTIEIRDEGAVVGRAHRQHLETLRNSMRLSASRLFGTKDLSSLDARRRQIFRAQAWAAVHLLLIAQGDFQSGHANFSRYLQLLDAGETPGRAFVTCFGTSGEGLMRRLDEVMRRQGFSAVVLGANVAEREDRLTLDPLSYGEAVNRLGRLALALGRPDLATLYFEKAIVDHPEDADARAGLAAAEVLRRSPP